jgi:hypothetical protein
MPWLSPISRRAEYIVSANLALRNEAEPLLRGPAS